MIKNLFICLFCILLASCAGKKSSVIVTKSASKTTNKSVSKPVVNKSAEETKSASSSEVLAATTSVKVTTALVLEYIAKYEKIAKQDMITYGIPASITLAQGILESGAGTGPLSAQANNHFGIKCHLEWNGPSIKYDDDAEQECFRKYSNPEESYRDHSMFLTSRTRYAGLFKLPKDDFKSWAKGLKAAGYATDVNYPTKLISLIERYNLQKYDAEVLGKEVVFITKNQNNLECNNCTSHEVIKGDTLYSLSKKYNISLEELRSKNSISENGIQIGQKLIIK